MTTPNNLPAELSSFVGRERQLTELRRLLRKSRLITLTGPGGAGKTRLALRLAAEVQDRQTGGPWLVELATLGDAGLLAYTVASVCGIRENKRRPILEVLVEGLAHRRALLILDGCEHLVEACSDLSSRLLRSCPDLTLIATSREPLGVQGELIWRTPSLSMPNLDDAGHPELALESESVRLFVERARLSQPGFELDQTVSAVVAEICTRLEGMPLAIELAAGLARVMSLQEILGRLHDRFRLLTGGSRSSLPRHQTLRQAVDWSYGLLSPAERALLTRLAVFAGGFDLDAAEVVAEGEPVEARGVLAILSRLVDKSLVTAETDRSHRTRYRLLDTIREYALDKLDETENAAVRRRHAAYFVQWSRNSDRQIRAHEQLTWLSRLDEETPNLRLALEWSLAELPDGALRLAGSLGRYWNIRCHFSEGLGWLNRALAADTSSVEARAAALNARSTIHWMRGEYAGARRDAEECVELARRLNLGDELCGGLTMLALLSAGDGDWAGAARLHEESLQTAWRFGDPWRVASSLNNLALIATGWGEHEIARKRLEQAMAEFQRVGDRLTTAFNLDSLAWINLHLKDNGAARRYYLESLVILAEFEETVYVGNALEGLALVAVADGDLERGVRLMGAAKSLRTAIGAEPSPEWKKETEKALADARAGLGRQAAEAAWKQGGAMNMEESVRYANGAAARPARDGSHPLTARERQVATLIAQGLTNPEIATRLKMADRTADAHVEHIRNKLGLRSRSQIAVWAHERLGRP